jgi:hypothetical protein
VQCIASEELLRGISIDYPSIIGKVGTVDIIDENCLYGAGRSSMVGDEGYHGEFYVDIPNSPSFGYPYSHWKLFFKKV